MIEAQTQCKETRERIFSAAAALFAERGYGSVSMREIAERAGVSKPMPYYYFKSKLDLCRALLDEGINCMLNAMSEIASQPLSATEKMRRMVRARFQHIRENPNVTKFYMNFLWRTDESDLVREYRARLHYALRIMVDLIAEGQAKGEFRTDINPATAANIFTGSVNVHIAQNIHLGLGTPTLDDSLAEAVMELFVNGMKASRKS